MNHSLNHKTLLRIAVIIITVALLAFLASQIEAGDVIRTLAGIKPLFIIAGFLVYSASYFFRALRFQILVGKEIRLNDLFNIVCVHNLVNCILPARTGELSYIYLLKKIHRRTTGEGIATLLVARVFDFMVITLFFVFSLLYIRNRASALVETVWVSFFIIIIIILLLVLLFHSGKHLLNTIKCYSEKLQFERWHPWRYIMLKSEETLDCLEKMKSPGSIRYLQIGLVTCAIWLSQYLVIYILVMGMDISLGFLEALFASTFAIVSTVLPISGIAGFGTTEGAWTIGFMLVGLTKEEAISSGFSYHIILIMYFLILGLYGLFVQKIWRIMMPSR